MTRPRIRPGWSKSFEAIRRKRAACSESWGHEFANFGTWRSWVSEKHELAGRNDLRGTSNSYGPLPRSASARTAQSPPHWCGSTSKAPWGRWPFFSSLTLPLRSSPRFFVLRNFGRLAFGCIQADFCDELLILIVQDLCGSTSCPHSCTANTSGF